MVSRMSDFVKGNNELNTYSYSLPRSNHTEKALYIFDLNTKIFLYKSNVFDSLGEAYFETKNYTKALKKYYKVLTMQLDNENANVMVESIKSEIKMDK